MRMSMALPLVAAVGLGLAGPPALASDQQQLVSTQAALAFLAAHGVHAPAPPWRERAACKEDGSLCKADDECCSGACKPVAEGRACVPK